MTWILILFAHVGPMASNNSNALTNIPGFQSESQCKGAGDMAKTLVRGSVKEISYVCVPQVRQ